MISKTVLDNGVTVVSQHSSHASATAIGVWLLNGSRHQSPGQSGYAHLIEHLLFKGTQTLSAPMLACEFERMGGQINAHTGRELTALHGVVPTEQVPRLVGLFAQMLLNPRFDDHDLALEKEVVLEEMAMVKDSPEEVLEEKSIQHCWPSNPISWPILGDVSHLEQADAGKLRHYLDSALCGARTWIVSAGGTQHDELLAGVAAAFKSIPKGSRTKVTKPHYQQHNNKLNYRSNRACFFWTFPAPHIGDDRYHTAVLANHILGGGTSSRLFQQIREERGLVYDIQSQLELYSDCGLWTIATACEPDGRQRLQEAVEMCVEQLAHGQLTEAEICVSRDFIKSNLVIERGNIETAMERMSREEIYTGRTIPVEEHMARFNRVTAGDIQSLLREYWSLRSLDVLGSPA